MLTNALVFLIETAAGFFTVALLLRFMMQWARATPRNPVSDFVNAITNFAVRPARRVIPSFRMIDLATLVLAWLTQFLQLILVLQVVSSVAVAPGIAMLALMAVIMVVRLLLIMIMVIVIVQAVLSWVNPYSPVAPILNALTRPLLRPFQRRIPPVANVDLSPLFVIVICQLLLILLASIA